MIDDLIREHTTKRILLVPSDRTRPGSGDLTQQLYHGLTYNHNLVHVMPALGTHRRMSPDELEKKFSTIPLARFLHHDHMDRVKHVCTISGDEAERLTGHSMSIDFMLSEHLFEYDLVISIGEVVPHEVTGYSNFTKNIAIGCGGRDFIGKSHYLGARIGLKNILSKADNPVRSVLNYAVSMAGLPVIYVMQAGENIFIGQKDAFHHACQTLKDRHLGSIQHRIVVYLDEERYTSFWLANKAIYRTTPALGPNSELMVIAPGISRLGENPTQDRLIEEFGYCGKERIEQLVESGTKLAQELGTAAHLIHGSADFEVFYMTQLPKKLIEKIGFIPFSVDDPKNYSSRPEGHYHDRVFGDYFFIPEPGISVWRA